MQARTRKDVGCACARVHAYRLDLVVRQERNRASDGYAARACSIHNLLHDPSWVCEENEQATSRVGRRDKGSVPVRENAHVEFSAGKENAMRALACGHAQEFNRGECKCSRCGERGYWLLSSDSSSTRASNTTVFVVHVERRHNRGAVWDHGQPAASEKWMLGVWSGCWLEIFLCVIRKAAPLHKPTQKSKGQNGRGINSGRVP